MAKSEISAAFAKAGQAGRAAVMPFLMAGDPSLDDTVALALACAEGGADLLEIGWPFSDPIADGPTIQAASQRALSRGVGRHEVLAACRQIRERANLPVVLLSYLNPLLALGELSVLAEAGLSGLVVPDLAFEERDWLQPGLDALEMALIPFAAPTSSDQRLAEIGLSVDADAFVYCVSLLGVTGARGGVPGSALPLLRRARAVITAPLALGFGISGPLAVAEVCHLADGVIVGSALVDLIGREGPHAYGAVEGFVRELVRAGSRS